MHGVLCISFCYSFQICVHSNMWRFQQILLIFVKFRNLIIIKRRFSSKFRSYEKTHQIRKMPMKMLQNVIFIQNIVPFQNGNQAVFSIYFCMDLHLNKSYIFNISMFGTFVKTCNFQMLVAKNPIWWHPIILMSIDLFSLILYNGQIWERSDHFDSFTMTHLKGES